MSTPPASRSPRVVIVLPVYNDWDSLLALLTRLDAVFLESRIAPSLVIVDDGSHPVGPEIVFEGPGPRAIGCLEIIRLHVNLGHQSAIAVGLSEVQRRYECDVVIVMDADGEDRPEDIPRLLEAYRAHPGRIIVARRSRRSEHLWFRAFYGLYRGIFRVFAGLTLDYGNFCMIPQALLGRMVYNPMSWNHLAAAIARSGLDVVRIPTIRGSRLFGESRMSFARLVMHGLSAVSGFLDIVMIRILILSSVIMLLSILGVVVVVWLRLFTELAIPGWATSAVGVLSIIGIQGLVLSTIASFVVLRGRSWGVIIPAIDGLKYIDRVERIRVDE